jgi:hypothetical protein
MRLVGVDLPLRVQLNSGGIGKINLILFLFLTLLNSHTGDSENVRAIGMSELLLQILVE